MGTDRYQATDLFGADVAETYDDEPGNPRFDGEELDRSVAFLADLAAREAAGDRPPDAFELAIGTGRVAVPLAARGVEVAGVDLSAAMLARLRCKPGAGRIDAHEGGMTDFRLGRTFGLVYLVFNTIGNVTSQDGQVAVFETAAAHLRPGGRFVIEMNVPDLQRLPKGERFRPFTVTDRHVGIDEYDVVEQGLTSHHYLRDSERSRERQEDSERSRERQEDSERSRERPGNSERTVEGPAGAGEAHGVALRRRSVPFRYVWPAELDLMARIAGLTRDERWSDWDRAPFTALSDKHVSVWRKPLT